MKKENTSKTSKILKISGNKCKCKRENTLKTIHKLINRYVLSVINIKI